MYTEEQIADWANLFAFPLCYCPADSTIGEVILVYAEGDECPFGQFNAIYQKGILQGYSFTLLDI